MNAAGLLLSCFAECLLVVVEHFGLRNCGL